MLGGGKEQGQAAKSPHVVYVVLSPDVEVHSDPPAIIGAPTKIFHTRTAARPSLLK